MMTVHCSVIFLMMCCRGSWEQIHGKTGKEPNPCAGIKNSIVLLDKHLAIETLKMALEEALTLFRAFGHYFNFMGIVETHHRIRKGRNVMQLSKSLASTRWNFSR